MAEAISRLQRNRIHRALSRPNLVMGADRELVLITGLAAVILIFVVLTIYSALLGVAAWIVIVGALRMMAKSDPLMRQVYARTFLISHTTSRPRHRGGNIEGAVMVALNRFRATDPSFADLVPYAGLVDNGILLLKDGSLMAGWYFAGPDSESATDVERNELSRQINAILSRLGSAG